MLVGADEERLASVTASAPWPAIEGIDGGLASRQWGGDADLFLTMLERFLDEYEQLAFPAEHSSEPSLIDYATRIHKLRGGAAMLAATGVHRVAEELERACRQAAEARARILATDLVSRLEILRRSSTPAIHALRERSERARGPADSSDLARIAELVRLLRSHSLAAAPRFSVLSSRLRAIMGFAAHRLASNHLDGLQFEAAADLIELNTTDRSLPNPPGNS